MKSLVRIETVEPLENFTVRLGFTDGSTKQIDLEPYLRGPVFEPIRKDRSVFLSVKVDKRMKTIVWDNGADIDPDVLYHAFKPAWQETGERSAT